MGSRKINRINFGERVFFLLIPIISIILNFDSFGQGSTSSIGDRESIGIYGGPGDDLTFVNTNQRLFAGIKNPATLSYSDDLGQHWWPAFPYDSLEYKLGQRGWGGGALRVLSNQKGWIAALTGINTQHLSAAVISYDGGDESQTAFDPYLLKQYTGEDNPVECIALTDHFLYSAMGDILLRMNDTMSNFVNKAILKLDTLPGYVPGSFIKWIAASNDISGYPLYYLVEKPSGSSTLYKFYGNLLFELLPPSINQEIINIFTHPAQIAGDTVFISCYNTFIEEFELYKSYSGGFGWTPVLVPGIDQPLADADYSFDWAPLMPLSNGLRLSFPGRLISDDLGDSWQGPALGNYGVATHPADINQIFTSNNVGVAASNNGIFGPFINTLNNGFTNVNVNQFAQSQSIVYVATDAGLAFTEEYYNPLIIGQEQWMPPNGLFPVPNTGDQDGVSAVAVNPANSDHVICGYGNGFNVTFSGPTDFQAITPPNWNINQHLDPWVTDIRFVNSNLVIAITGLKHKNLSSLPAQPMGNIWRSLDGGLSWNLVTPIFPNEYEMGNCLALGNNAGQMVIYSGTGYDDGLNNQIQGAIWSSLDFGDTWVKVNDAPVFGGSSLPLPIYDIDVHPMNNDIIYLSAKNIFARSDNGGLNYFFTDIPYNTGAFTSALINPQFPDSLVVTAGNNIYKYSFLIDDADMKFSGMPGEHFICSEYGSILGGSEMGGSKIIEAPTHFLELKAYLEGPFDGINLDMKTGLNDNGYLPLSQPFNVAPWYYNGTESVPSIPSPDIVDWVLVELRKTEGDSSTAIEDTRFNRQAAFLLKDGRIVEEDGITELRFCVILSATEDNDKVHGIVLSPSHTNERTANEMSSAKSNTFTYDFTTGADQVYGGIVAHKELAPGIWGMMSGDGNHDGQVGNNDKNDVWLAENGNSGYYFGDFNRDGIVDDIDIIDYWKPNAGRGNKID